MFFPLRLRVFIRAAAASLAAVADLQKALGGGTR